MVESSVTEPGLLESVPADRPTVAVFEGLSMSAGGACGSVCGDPCAAIRAR